MTKTAQWLSTSLLICSSSVFASGGSPAPAPAPAPAPVDPNTVTKTYSGFEWQRHALDLERNLDKNSPLAQATFVGTHNSYNSSEYADATRYLDPNQKESIREQLDMGARFIELDVHDAPKFDTHGSPWAWNWTWNQELILCHGQSNHLGCSSADRYFRDGLSEIRDFVANNTDEVVLLYIEDHMDGEYDEAAGIINDRLGNYVYRPTQQGSGCQSLNMSTTKQQILNAGKNIIVITGGSCSSNNNYNSWVFGTGYSTRTVANASTCDGLSRAQFDAGFVRFFEDRTNLSALFGSPGAKIETGNIAQLLKCGSNVLGMDDLTEGDGRLQASIWSWGQNEPNNYNGAEDCAESRGDGKFNDNNCNAVRQFACHRPGTHDWYVTNGSGNWTAGNSTCSNETGGQFVFAVPANSFENEQLKAAKAAKGVSNTWLNYHDRNTEGQWNYTTAQ